MKMNEQPQAKSSVPGVFPIWLHWSAEDTTRPRRSVSRQTHPPRHVRVLPGNPSLPLRVLLTSLSRGCNGGLHGSLLGMDLSIRAHEVRKLFYAGGFTGVLLRENIDPEEFLQEVYRGLLARNRGTCPWDAKKSSFGHYVHIVIRCVLSNYLRRERLRDSRESVTADGELPLCSATPQMDGVELRDLVEGVFGVGEERDRVFQFLSLLYSGRSRRDSLALVGLSESWGNQVLTDLRAALTDK